MRQEGVKELPRFKEDKISEEVEKLAKLQLRRIKAGKD